ncbi:hypothetical protein TNCV_2881001 [Trichonephila clavipes]|nr:hypothetical protein TNCV_2881001 [Trichonephila clavipes]
MHKGQAGRPRTSTSETSSVGVLDAFTLSPQKSTSQSARETGGSRASLDRILQRAKWKVYILQILHTLNQNDPFKRIKFSEWYLVHDENDVNFVSQVMWSLLLMGLPQERGVQMSGEKKIGLQEALDLLQNLPSVMSDVQTDNFSDEEVPANNLLEFSLDS